MQTTKKLKLFVVGDSEERNRVFKYIRDEQYKQYQALNSCMSVLATQKQLEYMQNGKVSVLMKSIEQKENTLKKVQEKLDKLLAAKTQNSEKITETQQELKAVKRFIEEDQQELEMAKQLQDDTYLYMKEHYVDHLYQVSKLHNFVVEDMSSLVIKKAKKDFKADCKNGLLRGERSVRKYKRDNPLMIRGRDIKFIKNEKNEYLFIIYPKAVNATFKVVNRARHSENTEQSKTLDKVVSGEAKVCESSFMFDKNNNLFLLLVLDINVTSTIEKRVKDRVVGVDLGLSIPAYVSLNDVDYVRKGIGSMEDFLNVRLPIESQKKRIQKYMASN